VPWIALEDVVGMYVAALSNDRWAGPVNACAPEAVTNADFSRALGRALKRPAVLPIPGFALRLLYGEMASVVTASQRMVPKRALELGYEFRHTDLDEALRAALK
jgi:NAD dependent epimerase/dehydratase family enzyme